MSFYEHEQRNRKTNATNWLIMITICVKKNEVLLSANPPLTVASVTNILGVGPEIIMTLLQHWLTVMNIRGM